MNVAHPLPSTVTSVSFSFLTSEDIRQISVKQITNPGVFGDGRPIINGLYDPALGPSDRSDVCVHTSHCLNCLNSREITDVQLAI